MHWDNVRRKNAGIWDGCWEKTRALENTKWHKAELVPAGGVATLQGAHGIKALGEREGIFTTLSEFKYMKLQCFTCLKQLMPILCIFFIFYHDLIDFQLSIGREVT